MSNPTALFANALVSTGAITVNVEEPFRWTSGILAPIYVDCRSVLGFPEQRKSLVEGLAELIETRIRVQSFDVVVGGATAGIPMASLLAEHFEKPLAYVRKEAKGHGKSKQIEGADVKGKRVLLFDELVSRGSSVSTFVPALRDAGAIVHHFVALLSYDTADLRKTVDSIGVTMHHLLTLEEALAAASMTDSDRAEVDRFRAATLT